MRMTMKTTTTMTKTMTNPKVTVLLAVDISMAAASTDPAAYVASFSLSRARGFDRLSISPSFFV